jgi:membrane protein required for colicin V production
MDRFLGALFGTVRGVLLVALFILGGKFAGFSNDVWWEDSKAIPHLEVVAEWLAVMAPHGLDLITPDEPSKSIPVELPIELSSPIGT